MLDTAKPLRITASTAITLLLLLAGCSSELNEINEAQVRNVFDHLVIEDDVAQ